ncbi:hypothetical protein YC2023_110154 [Brassica napus]
MFIRFTLYHQILPRFHSQCTLQGGASTSIKRTISSRNNTRSSITSELLCWSFLKLSAGGMRPWALALNMSTRSSDEHYESLLIVFFLSTIGSTQTTWRSKIFAAAIQCEADFVGSVWQRFSVRRWS